jgi:protocatechuate 3,4-dioxygenase beta subunit
MQINKTSVTTISVLLNFMALSYSGGQTRDNQRFQRARTEEGYAICGSCTVPKNLSSAAWLPPKGETGTPVIIDGTIYKSDGATPDSGVTLFLYQADAGGYYHRPKEDVFNPTIHGWLMTGRDGRYEIHTIKPAPEILAADEPAHIHAQIFGNGMLEHFLPEFWFQGDRNIMASDSTKYAKLGDFSPIVKLTKGKDGILHGTRNIRVNLAPPWKYETE